MSKAAEPLVGKPAESTPLVSSSTDGDVKSPEEQMKTFGALVLLVTIAVIKTQLTAYLFSYSHYPTAYSLWSCIVTCVMLVPIFIFQYFVQGKPMQYPHRAMAPTLFLIVFFTSFDLGFTNIALAELSTALQQCIAATNPFWTILIETALYQKFQHFLIYGAVTMVVVGSVLTSIAPRLRSTTFGVIAAVVAVLCSASKYVFTHSAFKKFKGDLGALQLLFWVDLFMIPIYLIWTMSNGELFDLFNVAFAEASTFWQMTGTAALGGVRALTQYIVLAFVSATSMSTANIFTQTLNIVISIPIQDTEVTPMLISGISVVIIFSSFYTYMKTVRSFLPWFDETFLGKKPPMPKEVAVGASAT